MYRIRFIFFLLIISYWQGYSQIQRIAEELGITSRAAVESEVSSPDSASISDSIQIAALTEQIQFYKLNEILLQEKLSNYEQSKEADSLSIIQRKTRIDSLRNVTQGIPVVIDEDTLFSFYAARSGNTANNAKKYDQIIGQRLEYKT